MTRNRSREGREDLESTRDLLTKARAGEQAAYERIFQRFVPALRRWASGRIPPLARGLVETDDVVQVSLIRALSGLDRFDPQRPGAFLAYLHQILINCVRDEIRRADRRPVGQELESTLPPDRELVIEETLGTDLVGVYERALAELKEDQQEAIVLRVEFGFTYREIAEALGRRSPNAVRMEISRGLAVLASRMAEIEGERAQGISKDPRSEDHDLD